MKIANKWKDNLKIRVITDTIINFVGAGIPVAVIQLFIYPKVARDVGADKYGQIQSMISLVYLLGATFGDALCSARLIQEKKYDESGEKADFNIIWLHNLILLFLLATGVLAFYYKIYDLTDYLLIILTILLSYCCSYWVVGFRLQLNYKSIFINHVLGGIGYSFGYFLFFITGKWELIFIIYFSFRIGHYLHKINILSEPFKKSKLYRKSVNSFWGINIAAMISKALTYFDKLILYPLLGGELVSIYYVANILGKLVLQLIEPLTNVILSYLAKEKSVSINTIKKVLSYGALFSIISYVFCMILSKPIIGFLYPQWAEEAYKLVPVAVASLCVASLGNILYPFTLKFMDTRLQIVINLAGFVSYVLCVIMFYKDYGLLGCSWALLIGYVLKLIVMLFFSIRGRRNGND